MALHLYTGLVPAHPRILALDVGDKRVGVALSDELGLTAQPYFTLHRSTPREDVKTIARMCRKHAVVEIVVGLPLRLSGQDSPQTVKTRRFADELAARTGLPLHFHDERLSSQAAHEILSANGAGAGSRKDVVDQVAAAVILQSYMDELVRAESTTATLREP